MNVFASVNSTRNEFMTEKRSKDNRSESAYFKRKMRENQRLTFFLSGVSHTFKEVKK
jgi:hypothetical protein